MGRTHVVVNAERWIHGAAHLAVLVALPKSVCTWGVAKLRSLGQELSGVVRVDEQHVVHALLVQEGQLVKSVRKLCGSVLGGPFEPLDAFLWPLRQAQLPVQLRNPKSVHCSRVL